VPYWPTQHRDRRRCGGHPPMPLLRRPWWWLSEEGPGFWGTAGITPVGRRV